jgi:hypothetical protein
VKSDTEQTQHGVSYSGTVSCLWYVYKPGGIFTRTSVHIKVRFLGNVIPVEGIEINNCFS